MYKIGALLLGMVFGVFIAVALATTSAAQSPDVPQIATSCLAIDGVPYRVNRWHNTWVEASVASTTAPAEWINLTLVKKMRELRDTECEPR